MTGINADRLQNLGYDDAWAVALAAADVTRLAGCSLEPARVTRTDRGACDLLGAAGPLRATWGADVLAAVARDPLAGPSTGDWAVVQRWPDGLCTIEVVLPRRTACTTRARRCWRTTRPW